MILNLDVKPYFNSFVEDFIAEYVDALNADECQQLINHFEAVKNLNLTYRRGAMAHRKNDEAELLLENLTIAGGEKIAQSFLKKFWEHYEEYASHYSVLRDVPLHGIMYLKLQKTRPGEGYHVWHFEDDNFAHANRILTWMVYLNDVEEGGETEFLYLRKRIKPERGTLLIWPSGFPHTHRGNPPLSGDKYIMTGWVEWIMR